SEASSWSNPRRVNQLRDMSKLEDLDRRRRAMRLIQRIIILTIVSYFAVAGGRDRVGATTSADAVAPIHGSPGAAALGQPALDLPAMVIRPRDLNGGDWVQADSSMTFDQDAPGATVTVRTYVNVLKLPEPSDWNRPRQAIGTTISEYTDVEAAIAN